MKRKIALVLTFVMMSVFIMACGGKDDAAVIGTWELDDIVNDEISLDDLKQYLGDFNMTFEFQKGGKVTLDMMGTKEQGKYTVDGNIVTIKDSQQSMDLTLDGDTLTFTEPTTEVQMVLKKQ